jgi:hypothetical protein
MHVDEAAAANEAGRSASFFGPPNAYYDSKQKARKQQARTAPDAYARASYEEQDLAEQCYCAIGSFMCAGIHCGFGTNTEMGISSDEPQCIGLSGVAGVEGCVKPLCAEQCSRCSFTEDFVWSTTSTAAGSSANAPLPPPTCAYALFCAQCAASGYTPDGRDGAAAANEAIEKMTPQRGPTSGNTIINVILYT